MVDIYTNPDLYDSIHHDYEWDKTLIKAIAKDINGPVLELASGTGRLTQPILELGLQYKGLELSQPFLDRAKMKFGDTADFILGDMRDFDLQMEFDLIFIGFNSFLHNLKIEDAINCLTCIKKHLTKNGKFLVSIFYPRSNIFISRKGQAFPSNRLFSISGINL